MYRTLLHGQIHSDNLLNILVNQIIEMYKTKTNKCQ